MGGVSLKIIEIERISGIDRSILSRMKNNRRQFGLEILKKVSSFTGRPLDDLADMRSSDIFETIKGSAKNGRLE